MDPADTSRYHRDVVDEGVIGQYVNKGYRNTTKRSREGHRKRIAPVVRSDDIPDALASVGQKKKKTGPHHKKRQQPRKKRTRVPAPRRKKKKKKKKRRRARRRDPLPDPETADSLKRKTRALVRADEPRHPTFPRGPVVSSFGRRRRRRTRVPIASPVRRQRKRREPIVSDEEEEGEGIRKKKKKKRRRTVQMHDDERIRKYNTAVRGIMDQYEQTARMNETLVRETINLHKAEAKKTAVLSRASRVCATDASENYISEMATTGPDASRGDPMLLSREEMRQKTVVRFGAVMDAHAMHYGANYNPTRGSPAMLDRDLVDEDPILLGRDTAEGYVRMRTLSYFPEVECLVMRTARRNLVNSALNEVVRKQKRGFRNETYRSIPCLTVEDANEGLIGYDITKRNEGRCIDPVCANARQTSETDEEFMFRGELNNCVLYKFTNGRMTGRSWPRSADFGLMQTYARRRPCLGCLLYKHHRRHFEMKANAEEALTVEQEFTVYVGQRLVNGRYHSFDKKALLPMTKHFRGSVGPMLMFDMANFIFYPQFKRRSDGSGWIPALRVDAKIVYTPTTSPSPEDPFDAPPLDPPVRHTVSTTLPPVQHLLREKLDMLVDRLGGAEDDEEEGGKSAVPSELEGGRLHITSYPHREISFLKDVMTSDVFTAATDEPARAMLARYCRNFTAESVEDFLAAPIAGLHVAHRRQWKYLVWNPFQDGGESPAVGAFPRLALYILRVNLLFFVCIFLQIQLEKGNRFTDVHAAAEPGVRDTVDIVGKALDMAATDPSEDLVWGLKQMIAELVLGLREGPSRWGCLDDEFTEAEMEAVAQTEGRLRVAILDERRIPASDDLTSCLAALRQVVALRAASARKEQATKSRRVQKERSVDAVIHSSSEAEAVTVDNLKSLTDYQLYFLQKRLRRFLEAHITAMSVFEMAVRLSRESDDVLAVLRSPTPYLLLLPRHVRYDFSPFDVKHMDVRWEKHERPKRWERAARSLEKNSPFARTTLFGKTYPAILRMDLMDFGAHLKACCAQRGPDAFFATAVPFCRHFFPVRRLQDLVALRKLTQPQLAKLAAGRASSPWAEMALIADNVDGSTSWRGARLFDPLTHSVYWAWLLKVNMLQRLILTLNSSSLAGADRLAALATEVMCPPGTEVGELGGAEDYVTTEKARQFARRVTESMRADARASDARQATTYDFYVLLQDHTALGSEMVLRQVFDDQRLFGAPTVDGEYMVTGMYDFLRPEADGITVCAEDIPNVGPFLCTHHLDLKARDQKANPVSYCQYKVFPNICQIRKIAKMISAQWKTDAHARQYLTWIVWCTLAGLYRHAHHAGLAAHFPRMLQLRAQFYSKAELGGRNLRDRRAALFASVSANKFQIHDTLRENFVNALRYQPAVMDYYAETWVGSPHISWATFRVACAHNANFLRDFYARHGILPTGPELMSPTMKKAMRDRRKSAHVRANLARWGRRQNRDLYEAYRWMLSCVDNWGDLLNGMFLVVRALTDRTQWKLVRRAPSRPVPADVRDTLARLPPDDRAQLRSEFVYIYRGEPQSFQWMAYLLQQKHRFGSSLSASLRYWVRTLGLTRAAHLLWRNFDEIAVRRSGGAGSTGQARRARPLLYPGIYRLYDYGYVLTCTEIMKSVVEERLFVAVVGGSEIPVYLTMDPPHAARVRGCPHLGRLTDDYVRHYESVFDYLRVECGLSLSAYAALLATVAQYFRKESENKIAYTFRAMSVRDFQIVRCYFRADFARTKVRVAETRTLRDLPTLHEVLERNSRRWVNLVSVTPEVFATRFGFDYAQTGTFPRAPMLEHEKTYTSCCGRLARFPYHKGIGNFRAVKDMRVPVTSWVDDLVDGAVCRCHLFSGNAIDCPVHRNAIGDKHTPCGHTDMRCCMFKKNDRKKKITRGLMLLHELRGVQNEMRRLEDLGDDALEEAREKHAAIYKEARRKRLASLGLLERADALEEDLDVSLKASIVPPLGGVGVHDEPHAAERKIALLRPVGMYHNDNEAVKEEYGNCTIFGEMLQPGQTSDLLRAAEAMDVEDEVDRAVRTAVRRTKRKVTGVDEDDAMDDDDDEEDGEEEDEDGDANMVRGEGENAEDEEEEEGEGVPIDEVLRNRASFNVVDSDYGTYVRFQPLLDEDGDAEMVDGDAPAKKKKKKKKKRMSSRGKRTSESVYKVALENGLVDAISRWTKRYCKYRDSYRCGDPDRTVIQRVGVMGKTLLVSSVKEELIVYTWCAACGSFVRQHDRLFIGADYLCEACWMRRPETCFSFFDQVYEKTRIVPMQKAVEHLVSWVGDVKAWEEQQEEAVEFIDVPHEAEDDPELLPVVLSAQDERAIAAATIQVQEEEEEKGKKKKKASARAKRSERCSAYAISMCLAMEKLILLREMDRYNVYDPLADPRNESVMKIVQTKRRKRTGYFRSKVRIRNLEVFVKVMRGRDRRRFMDKVYGKYSKRMMW